MAGLAGIRKKAHCRIDWGLMLSGAGQTLFALAVFDLTKPLIGLYRDNDISTCRFWLQMAGFLVAAGWFLLRKDANQWPFHAIHSSRTRAVRRVARKVASQVLKAVGIVVASLSIAALIILIVGDR